MSGRTLWKWVIGVVCFLIAYALLGGWLVANGLKDWVEFHKGLVNLVVAVPAAILAFTIQRRVSYLNALRDLWKQLIPAVQEAIQYTYKAAPGQIEFSKVQAQLSTAIDSLRGVFKNVWGSASGSWLYPFENLKDIHKVISNLGFGPSFGLKVSPEDARKCITDLWKDMHAALLLEFDREAP